MCVLQRLISFYHSIIPMTLNRDILPYFKKRGVHMFMIEI